jgi:dienelactone hydrolase
MPFFLVAILLLLTTGPAAGAEPLRFAPDTVGGPSSMEAAELYEPNSAGPHPAVVVLHGCNGVGQHERLWAQQLAAWGYVALIVDSFRPRGVGSVCNQGMLVPPRTQAEDAFAAAAYLRSRPEVAASRIGVIGFSHGGWAVLKAVQAGLARPADAPPFAAAVAFYPGCDPPVAPIETDTLILIGEADDWTPAERCERWVGLVQRAGHEVQLKTYPGALHSFDAPLMPHFFAGHYIGRDPAAAADALNETERFLGSHLLTAQGVSSSNRAGVNK